MALVLSEQQNIDLLMLLVKIAIAIGTIAILLILAFWLRLKTLEKRIYLSKKPFKSRLVQPKPRRLQKSLVTTQFGSNHHTSNLITHRDNHRRSPVTQVFYGSPKTITKSAKRSVSRRWLWLLAIAIACITGIAIALMQLGNSFISPEFASLIWFLIGVMLLVSATFVKIA